MTDDITRDTTIAEPAMAAGEADILLFALERSRAQFAWKCGGLDAAALRKPHPPSAMTIGGLIKHMALVEYRYVWEFLTGEPVRPLCDMTGWTPEAVDWEWRTAADNSPAELYALWRDAVKQSRDAVAALLAAGDPGQPTKFTTSTGEHPNLRRVLVDIHDEYARHVGHADLFRESIDGLVGEDPPQPSQGASTP